ncbi:hypothetical protein [Haloferax sp. Atlit-48N]|uniref:Uncharacterized protein n=1 Tax=Haloferax sp. Atlit-48N TaxID=2077198 RepID=A0ACD5HWG2_9EURY|nr:hypothetical protein [Haloferax sp. Atlit-48N]
MTEQIQLNETELLLLHRQMEGDVSGLNYSLEATEVKRASFSGSSSGNFYDSPPVKATSDYGEIVAIKFQVMYDGEQLEPDREVLLTIYEDGKLNCQTPVLPKLLDRVCDEITLIMEHDGFLTPLGELLSEFTEDKFATRPTRDKDSFEQGVKDQLTDLIEHYFDTDVLSDHEISIYTSILANLAVSICENGLPDSENTPWISSSDSTELPIDDDSKVQEFIFEYSRRVNDIDDIDKSDLVDSLNYILESDWEQPLNVIDSTVQRYGLST